MFNFKFWLLSLFFIHVSIFPVYSKNQSQIVDSWETRIGSVTSIAEDVNSNILVGTQIGSSNDVCAIRTFEKLTGTATTQIVDFSTETDEAHWLSPCKVYTSPDREILLYGHILNKNRKTNEQAIFWKSWKRMGNRWELFKTIQMPLPSKIDPSTLSAQSYASFLEEPYVFLTHTNPIETGLYELHIPGDATFLYPLPAITPSDLLINGFVIFVSFTSLNPIMGRTSSSILMGGTILPLSDDWEILNDLPAVGHNVTHVALTKDLSGHVYSLNKVQFSGQFSFSPVIHRYDLFESLLGQYYEKIHPKTLKPFPLDFLNPEVGKDLFRRYVHNIETCNEEVFLLTSEIKSWDDFRKQTESWVVHRSTDLGNHWSLLDKIGSSNMRPQVAICSQGNTLFVGGIQSKDPIKDHADRFILTRFNLPKPPVHN